MRQTKSKGFGEFLKLIDGPPKGKLIKDGTSLGTAVPKHTKDGVVYACQNTWYERPSKGAHDRDRGSYVRRTFSTGITEWYKVGGNSHAV